MRPSRKTLLRLIAAGLDLLLTLRSCTVFAACGIKEDGSWMRYHSAQTTVTICAAVLSAFLFLPALMAFEQRAQFLSCFVREALKPGCVKGWADNQSRCSGYVGESPSREHNESAAALCDAGSSSLFIY